MAQIGYRSGNKSSYAQIFGSLLGVDGFLITSDSKDIHDGDGRWIRPSIHSKGCTKFRIQGEVWRSVWIDQLRIIALVLWQFIVCC